MWLLLNVLVFNVWLPERKKEKEREIGYWLFQCPGNHITQRGRDFQ
jgi:hypothetical protein